MLDLKELFLELKKESNCPEPSMCVLLSKEGRVVASGANYCEQKIEIHAEVMSLRNMEKTFQPYRAVLYGSYCDICKDKLKKAGVEVFTVI